MEHEDFLKEMVKSVYAGRLASIDNVGLVIQGVASPIKFKSGDSNAVNRYFTTKISSIYADVELSYDVLPRFWPKKLSGSLYLKTPQFIPSISYDSIRPDKITTYYKQSVSIEIADEPDYTSYEEQLFAKRREHLFNAVMSKLSWADYAGKWVTSFDGRLSIDAQNLKDLKGITNFLGDNCELGSLQIKNFEGEVMDLTDFKFARLNLVDCRFDSIKGMPEKMFSLTIKNATRYSTPFDNDIKQFDIKFPRILQDNLIIYSEDGKHPEQSLFDFGDMTVLGDLRLKNINAVGKIAQSDVLADIVDSFKMRAAPKAVEIINVNRDLDFSYNDRLNIEVSGSLLSIRVENSKTPKCTNLKCQPTNLILKGITGSYLADDSLPYASIYMIFKDCSATVINALSAKCAIAKPTDYYTVFIEGLPQNGDSILDLGGFKDAGFISVDGYQFDKAKIANIKKKLLIKYPLFSKSALDKEELVHLTKMRTTVYNIDGQKPWQTRSMDEIPEYETLYLNMKNYHKDLKSLKPVISVANFMDRFVDYSYALDDIRVSKFDTNDTIWANPIHFLYDLVSVFGPDGAIPLHDSVFTNSKIPPEYQDWFEEYIDHNKGSYLLVNVLRYVDAIYRFTKTMPNNIEELFDGAITLKMAKTIKNSTDINLLTEWNWVTQQDYADETLNGFKIALRNIANRILASISVGGF